MYDCILFSVLVSWNVKLQDEMYGEVSKKIYGWYIFVLIIWNLISYMHKKNSGVMWTFEMFEEYNSYHKYFCWIVLF